MKKDMNDLEARQQLLVILMEECAELQQACAKLLRRGIMYDSSDKYVTELKEEAGDVYAMLELLHEWDVVSLFEMEERRKVKFEKLAKWSDLIDESDVGEINE